MHKKNNHKIVEPQQYHKYVFSSKKRSFLGKFEKMYQNEDIEKFDSWHQDDIFQTDRRIHEVILEKYNFNKILDIGCGKGFLTNQLKKNNNHILAIDLSKTAIQKAKIKYPNIDFRVFDISKKDFFSRVIRLNGPFDLIFSSEVFSYIKQWKEIISKLSFETSYFYISVYLPVKPIGYIKSISELRNFLKRNYKIVEEISLNKHQFFLLCQSLKKND